MKTMATGHVEAGMKRKRAPDDEGTKVTATTPSGGNEFSENLLKVYYDRLFPFAPMYNWLSYYSNPTYDANWEGKEVWQHREFCFTMEDDTYLRYRSYKGMKDWRDDIRKLCPHRMEIGPVYDKPPIMRKRVGKLEPKQREFVGDVDITDYDDVRICCSGGGICKRCWPLMACAVKCTNAVLRDDFDFKQVLWVFSGRRGIHVWIGDEASRKGGTDFRTMIIEYMKTFAGSEDNKIKVDLSEELEKNRSIHDVHRRMFDICLPYFVSCSLKEQQQLEDQDVPAEKVAFDKGQLPPHNMQDGLWGHQIKATYHATPKDKKTVRVKGCKEEGKILIIDHEEVFLGMIRSPALADAIRKKWKTMPGADSVAKWEVVQQGFQHYIDNKTNIPLGDNVYNLKTNKVSYMMRARNERKERAMQADEIKQLYAAGLMPICYEANLMEVVFAYVYPRLDVEVSRHMNHLLKSPFVVHPKTGKVCVPLDPDEVDDFDPNDRACAPTLRTLESELNAYYASSGEKPQQGFKEYEKIPSMSKAVAVFDKTCLKPIREWRQAMGVHIPEDSDMEDL